jgi:hypothetical protein
MNRRVFKRKRNHSLGASIVGLVGSVVNGIASIVPVSLAKRENTKSHLWTVLYSPVYLSGKTFAQVKASMPKTYKNNPDLFKRYYDELKSMRDAELEAGKHPSQTLFSSKNIILFILIIVVVIMTVIAFKSGKKGGK